MLFRPSYRHNGWRALDGEYGPYLPPADPKPYLPPPDPKPYLPPPDPKPYFPPPDPKPPTVDPIDSYGAPLAPPIVFPTSPTPSEPPSPAPCPVQPSPPSYKSPQPPAGIQDVECTVFIKRSF